MVIKRPKATGTARKRRATSQATSERTINAATGVFTRGSIRERDRREDAR